MIDHTDRKIGKQREKVGFNLSTYSLALCDYVMYLLKKADDINK